MKKRDPRQQQIIGIAQYLIDRLADAQTRRRNQDHLSEQDIRLEAAKLVEECYKLGLPPPLVLSTLVARCLGVKAAPFIEKHRDIPVDPKNYDAWDRAVLFEAEQSPVFGTPLTASVNSVASAAFPDAQSGPNPHRRTIKAWRESDIYTFCVNLARTPIGQQMISGGGWTTFPVTHPPKEKRRL